MKRIYLLFLILCLSAVSAKAQRIVIISGGVVTANVDDFNDFLINLNQNVTGVTLSMPTFTQATGYQITMRFVQDATGSRTVTFGGNITSTCTINATANATTICRWQYTASGNTWADAGGGGGNGVGNGAAPVYGIYLASSCPASDPDAVCIQTSADTKECNDCSWTNASTTITANTARFTAADVGKSAMGWQTCATDQASTLTGTGAISTTALVTITGFTDSQHVTISATPANTATFSGSYPQGGCFIYGHLDETGATAVDAVIAASTACPQVIMPNANYFFTNPHFFTNPASCIGIGPGIGQNYGNTILAAGMHVEGRGPGATTFFIAPSFPNGDACNHNGGATLGASNGCWAVTVMGQWTGIRFDGGSNALLAALNGLKFMVASVAQLRDITFTNLGTYNTAQMICLELNHNVILRQVNLSGCGQVGISVPTNTGNNIGYGVAVENDDQSLKVIGPDAFSNTGYQFTCFYCNFLQMNPTIAASNINSRAGSIYLVGTQVRVFSSSTTNGLTGYTCTTTTGCILDMEGSSIQYQFGGASNTNSAISCAVVCTTRLSKSTLASQSSGTDYTDVASSNLYDLGGNTFTPRFTVSGNNRHVETGTCTFAASTTCAVTFNRSYGATVPSFFVPPNIVGAATTLTVSALSATGATITASASNSSSVNWQAVLQ